MVSTEQVISNRQSPVTGRLQRTRHWSGACASRPDPLPTAGESEETRSHVTAQTSAHRVLIVDDHPDAAQALAMLVRMLGHECVAVTTGRAAIEQAHAAEFDLAIVDIGLPDVSGLEVARELRRLPTGSKMYLAAVSGYGQPEDRTNALQAGFDHHVLKPLDVAIVRRIVSLADRAAAAR
jgi:CheY-like chemotaxis protein